MVAYRVSITIYSRALKRNGTGCLSLVVLGMCFLGSGLCDELIAHSGESYRCVFVFLFVNSGPQQVGGLWSELGRCTTEKKKKE
jgi:hypothetical protein